MLNRLRPPRTVAGAHAPPAGKLAGVVTVAATLALGLVAGGCGSSKSSTTATLSKPQYLAQGNAICARGNQTLAAPDRALGARPTEAQIAAFVTSSFAPNIQSQIDDLRALAAPSADRTTVANILDAAQTDLNKIKSNPALLAGGSGFAEFAQLAHPYGLTSCAPGS
jgi:hypothetical protein